MINIDYTHNKNEYSRGINDYYNSKMITKIDKAIAFIMFILLAYFYIFHFKEPMFLILTCLFFGINLFYILRGQIIASLQFARNKQISQNQSLCFDNEGIHLKIDSGKSDVNWNFYTSVLESKMFFYILYGKDLFSMIPKRAFKDVDEENRFVDLLREKFSDYRKI